MYVSIIQQLKEIFENIVISEIPDGDDLMLTVYPHPLEKDNYPDSYPAVAFYPNDYNNEFASNSANMKQLKFRAVLMVNAEQIDNKTLFTFTLPNTADKVIEAIDNSWDMGTRVDGHRVWLRTDVGLWGKEIKDDGEVGFVDMDLLVKFQNKVD